MQEVQKVRERYIKILNNAENPKEKCKELNKELLALDLTVYLRDDMSFDSILYNSFAQSEIDENISMHPEQVNIINIIKNNDASVISAPTSFGKTFCVFEYIVKYKPKNVVLIVPTLALVDEYRKKIIHKYRLKFDGYKIYTGIDIDKEYNFEQKNIFILTHDKVVNESCYSKFEQIDFLVIDEVYKLEKSSEDDRTLVLNMAYYYLAKVARKYVLLAPYINEIKDIENLEKKPILYFSDYSPVVNDVIIRDIANDKDREDECKKILAGLSSDSKTLIYFPTVAAIYSYIRNVISNEDVIKEIPPNIASFIEWAKKEIHDDWGIVIALERGYLVHNGQLHIGTRMFQMDCYEKNASYNRMLCTSTLLEGVNTTAQNIIITRPSRSSNREDNNFSAFDFYNLVGRAGRLYKHYLGTAYYIKGPRDPQYQKEDAIRSVKFEITDDSEDIAMQTNNIEGRENLKEFLKELQMTYDEYMLKIGSRARVNTVKNLYKSYEDNKNDLLSELKIQKENTTRGRYWLVYQLQKIINSLKVHETLIITKLLDKRRPKIKDIINDIRDENRNIDWIITSVIRIKTSYIEYEFYNKCQILKAFMEKDKVEEELLKIYDDKILTTIEHIYYINSPQRKMLKEFGIYERDIEKVINVIGEDFDDNVQLKEKLQRNKERLTNLSFISDYIIKNNI